MANHLTPLIHNRIKFALNSCCEWHSKQIFTIYTREKPTFFIY